MEQEKIIGSAEPRTQIDLANNLDISQAMTLRQEFDAALQRAQPIDLHIERLQRIDAALVQLLVVFVREARQQKLPWRWIGVSPALATAAQLLGLHQHLQLATAEEQPT